MIWEKRMVTLSMLLMLAGGLLVAYAPGWEALVVGRVLACVGGVIQNIVLSKMVVDWFAGREMSTAMGLFVNSWPVGIALALALLPPLAEAGGVAAVWWVVTGLIGIGFCLFIPFYRPPPGVDPTPPVLKLTRLPLYPLLSAGLVWALYNAALMMIFAFGPAMLTQNGWSLAAAGIATSAFMVVFAIVVPIGGILADRTGRQDLIIYLSLASFVLVMPFVPSMSSAMTVTAFAVVGVIFALAPGPVMALPAMVLTPETRAFGMGVFYLLYYIVMVASPRIAGGVADRMGDLGVTFSLGAAMAALAILSLALFRQRVARSLEDQP